MCTNEDLVFGHGIDDELNRLMQELPGAFDESDPLQMVTALVVLDQRLGLHQDGDYILVTPGLAVWVLMMVSAPDPEVSAAIESHDFSAALFARITSEPFRARCIPPDNPGDAFMYPRLVRARMLRLRIMTEKEAEQLSFCYTVRADGTFIYRPGFQTRLAGNTQPEKVADLVG